MQTDSSLPWLTAAPPDLRLTMYSLIVVAVVGIGFAILYRQYAFKQWRRAQNAESELRRYALMLGDALQDAAENEAKADAVWDTLSPRLQAIDEARKKCAGNLAPDEPVGTFADPIYIQRPDVLLDDWAYVSTVEELTR